jgi:hypothetical protein
MAYPNLYSDESIVLNAQNVKVKSVSFEAVLTTRRLILVDSKKHLIAPQEILLATIRDIEVGENAIRDPTITLSIITTTGATRQMILTFSKLGAGERKRECDEWVKVLRQGISSAVQHPIMPDRPVSEAAYASPAPEIHAAPAPVNVEASASPAAASTPKKKIEVARPGPIKKIMDAPPAVPKPVETSTLPTGSFCNRCGNRVPPESAFCNKCGTPVVTESDIEAHLAATAAAQAPPAPSAVPQVQVSTPPVYGVSADKKDRPIEDVIHSIEPLIEDSVPRTAPYPLVPKQQYHPHQVETPEQPAAEAPVAAPAPEAAAPPADTATPGVSWPVLGSAGGPVEGQVAVPVPVADAPAPGPAAPVPPAAAPPRNKKGLIIGAVAVVLIIIIAAVFIFANPLGGGTTPTPVATPTPEITAVATAVPTKTPTLAAVVPTVTAEATTAVPDTSSQTSAAVPSNGVWVRVQYAGEFTGSYGTAGNVIGISGTGELIRQIPTSDGIVVANVQKADGSSDKLVVQVYKNGVIVQERSTTTPKGIAEIQVDLKPTATPTPTPTATKIPVPVKTTAAANATANATVTATTAAA